VLAFVEDLLRLGLRLVRLHQVPQRGDISCDSSSYEYLPPFKSPSAVTHVKSIYMCVYIYIYIGGRGAYLLSLPNRQIRFGSVVPACVQARSSREEDVQASRGKLLLLLLLLLAARGRAQRAWARAWAWARA
jgi:hypothetical protein